jgi:hypothetical protein
VNVRAAASVACALLSACATVPPPAPPRTPTAAERDEARRSVVRPYLDCMRSEAHKAAGARAVEAAELACGHLIQSLRRYGAGRDYDPLQWSGYVEQVERQGQAAAAAAARK